MTYAAWIALFSPAVGVCVIALAGQRISGRVAGYLASGSTLVSFVATLVVFAGLLGRHEEDRSESSTLWTWLSAGDLRFGLERGSQSLGDECVRARAHADALVAEVVGDENERDPHVSLAASGACRRRDRPAGATSPR